MSADNQQDEQNQNNGITLDKLQADLDSAMNNWKRAAADFENYKKQKERENKELLEFAKEVVVVKLLPTIDVLEQALKHAPQISEQWSVDSEQIKDFAKQYQNWLVGVDGIIKQLDKVFTELGVKKIEALGKKFDPHFHEAVKEIVCDKDDGMVMDELQSGFILNGKVIRPSQVIISKKE